MLTRREEGGLEPLIASAREAHRTGAWDDALVRYRTALARATATDRAADAADLLRWMGDVHRERGDLEAAAQAFEASRVAAEGCGARQRVASALNSAATVRIYQGKLDEAVHLLHEARALAVEIGSEKVVAMVDQNLGIVANIQGNAVLALLSYRSALAYHRRQNDDHLCTRALNNMAMAQVDLGEWEEAERCFAEAAALARRSGDRMMTGVVALNRSELHLRRHQYDEALECVERSLEVFQELRARANIAHAYRVYGVVYRMTGKSGQADTHFALALSMAEACQNRLLQAEALVEWALLLLEGERRQQGIVYMNRAVRIYRELEAKREVLDIDRRMDALRDRYLPAVAAWGRSHAEGRDGSRAGRVAEHARRLARAVGIQGWELAWIQIGALIHDVGTLAVPSNLRSRSEVFGEEERAYIEVKAAMGELLARQMEFPDEVYPIVRSQTERWSGGGLPDGLCGERIPLGARIVSIARSYDSLASPRSSRAAFSRDDALEIMQCDAGRFDPALLETFRDVLRRGTPAG